MNRRRGLSHGYDCTRPALLIEHVEELIADYYQRIQITPAMQQALAGISTPAETPLPDVPRPVLERWVEAEVHCGA